tara:strand:+ start:3248 stop:3928 length:681 start_codon:yes stop_codon:yes gene_type:complete
MDLNELKNLDFQTLKTKVLQIADKKTLIKFGISFGAVIFFLIIYYAILNPIVNAKKLRLSEMNEKNEEANKFISEIKGMNSKIKALTPQYEKYSTLFHTRAEVEDLYQTLSEHAGMNDLVITKIEKQTPKEVSKSEALAAGKKKKKKKKKKATKKKSAANVAYYTIPVDFEITGNFLGYIKFKRAISLSQKMINFDKETIKVVKGDTTGAIKVNGVLTIVGLADEF